MRRALTTIFGYTGFTLLQLGLLTINKVGAEYKIDTIIPSYKTIVKILNIMQIKSLFYSRTQDAYDPGYLNDNRNRARFFSSIFLTGQKQSVKLGDNNRDYLYSLLDSEFLDIIFHQFTPGVEDHVYHITANNLYLNAFYNHYDGRAVMGQRIADAKVKLLEILFNQILDTQVDIDTLKQYQPFSSLSDVDQTIWFELVEIYYKIALSDGLFFPQGRISNEALDPTATILDLILGILSPSSADVFVNGKTKIKNKLVQEYGLDFGVLLSKLTDNERRQISPALYYTYDHLFRSKGNLPNYAAMTTEKFWDLIEKPIEHTASKLSEIFSSNDLEHIDKFTIQFRRPAHSGINKDTNSGALSIRVHSGGENPEISGHNIVITRNDISQPDVLRTKLFSTVYYMVKYQAFIVVKSGLAREGEFIFGAMVHKIFGVEYLKSLTSDGKWNIKNLIVPSETLENWNSDWNEHGKWHDLNMYIPFHLLLDNNHINNANALKEFFSIKFGVTVESLIKSS